MVQLRCLVYLLFCCFLACPQSVFANPSGVPEILGKALDAQNKVQSALSPSNRYQGTTATDIQRKKIGGDPNDEVCPPGDTECIAPQAPKIAPSTEGRLNQFNYYGSSMGFRAGMDSEFHVKQTLEQYLNGSLTLAYITMGLTEPAVAAGLSQAVNYIGNDVNNRLQGEQVFFSQLQYLPEVGHAIGQAHMTCIAQKMSSSVPGATGPQRPMTWLAAQASCSGDTVDDLQRKERFTGNEGVSYLSFGDDSNHPNQNRGANSQDKYLIYLADYLFERDSRTASEGLPGSGANVRALKEAFVNIIGNVEYRLDNPESNPERNGTRTLSYKKIPPLLGGSGASFERVLQAEWRNTHEVMLNLFKKVCEFSTTGTVSGHVSNPLDVDPYFKGQPMETVGDKQVPVWAVKLSFPGFNFDSLLAQAIYDLDRPATDTATGLPSCPDYMTQYSFDELIQRKTVYSRQAKEILGVGRMVAMGRIYSMFTLAEQYIRKLNAGAFDNFARRTAFELLYEAAGGTDLQKINEDNLVAMSEFRDRLFERVAAERQQNRGMPGGGDSPDQGGQAPIPGAGGGQPA
jgi:hypothetical protein